MLKNEKEKKNYFCILIVMVISAFGAISAIAFTDTVEIQYSGTELASEYFFK